jgi:hypothetical protein
MTAHAMDDSTVRLAVLRRLEMLDHAAGTADATTLLPLARVELHRLAHGWRLLLSRHRADEDGRCTACRTWPRARRWPCQVWRAAHEQLIGESAPRRTRKHPLRNPFRGLNR